MHSAIEIQFVSLSPLAAREGASSVQDRLTDIIEYLAVSTRPPDGVNYCLGLSALRASVRRIYRASRSIYSVRRRYKILLAFTRWHLLLRYCYCANIVVRLVSLS